ncbi:MAG: type II/IV secretion system ATPase subunit, partial [Halodesulfurarchaeum sp.]
VVEGTDAERREVIERETRRLLERYDLYTGPERDQREFTQELLDSLGFDGDGNAGRIGALLTEYGLYEPPETDDTGEVEGLSARPEPAILEEDPATLSEYQVEKLLYALKRNFIGYERIDGIKHDINVEDISCDGYNSPVFAYHTDYEQLITNVRHGESSLDDFVVKMAQRSGKGISKRQPQVDATLPDGSRAQLTLGTEVSDHGTNYTIRQFKDVPFTPVDLINWKTFSLDEMAFLWLCIENNKSLLFAGGTASGKTTSLNAVSLFIPSNAKIVSIEDTREVELPQRNWIASVTRPSFGEDETGDIDEFDLLEAALRQRPDYIIMGEVRGEEGRTLFQVMSTGHTTYTTFHADNVSEVIKRFTTDPINVSKTLFTALDLISIQAQTRIRGKKVRRSRNITEIRRYDPENDEINVNDVFQWRPETDTYRRTAESTTLDEIKFDRGWTEEELDRKLFERRTVLAFLIENGLNTYAEVAATVQAYINDPETILTLIANGQLQDALADLRGMESVLIDVDEEKEEMVPRPDPDEETRETATEILDRAEEDLFPEYRGETAPDISEALTKTPEDNVVVGSTPGEGTVEGRDTATGEATEDGLDEFVDVDEALSDGAAETHEREGNSTGWEAAEGGDFQVDDSSDESHDPDETDGGEGER